MSLHFVWFVPACSSQPDALDDGIGAGGDVADQGSGPASADTGSNATTTTTASSGADLPDVVHPLAGVTVETLAGSDVAGDVDGAPALFRNPVNVAVSLEGDVLVADYENDVTRQVLPNGMVTTITSQVGFSRPFGLAYTPGGDVVAETDWNEAGVNTGALWLLRAGASAELLVSDLGRPRGLVALSNGTIVLSDIKRHDLRRYDPSTGVLTVLAGLSGTRGATDGHGEQATFDQPYGIVVDLQGNIIVADQANHRLRRVSLEGEVSTIAGDGPDMIDGPLGNARFSSPQDLAIDAQGNLFVSDRGNHRIRRISVSGEVETVAGDGDLGYLDGDGESARFFGQEGLDVTPDGKTIYVADGTGGEPGPYHRVRKITVP